MMRYTARDDWQLDQRLLGHDLRATLAHVRGLRRIEVLNDDELVRMTAALEGLVARYEGARAGASVIESEHMLLGLLREGDELSYNFV